MKKIYTPFLSVFFLFTLQVTQAQITLDASNNWEVGQTYTYNLADGNTFDAGPSGSDVSWDFSGMSVVSTTSSEMVDISDMDNGNLFPSANIGFVDLDTDNEGYYFTSNSAQSFYGAVGDLGGGLTATVIYDDPQDMLQYPMTMGDSFTDTFGGTVTSTGEFDRSGTTVVNIDAWGSLTTPAGTFSDVVRVVTVMNYSDVFMGSPFADYVETRYFWYDTEAAFPLLEYIEIEINGTQGVATFAYLDAVPVSTQSPLAEDIQLSVFPNPATDQVNIEYALTEGSEVVVSVCNLLGKEVLMVTNGKQAAGRYQLNTDLSDLPNGTYFVKMNIGGELASHKLQVQR